MTNQAPNAKWEALDPLPTLRAYPAALYHQGFVYVIGGCNQVGQPLDAFEVYDPVANTWKQLPSMTVKRAQPSVVLHKDKLVVIGGCKELNRPVQEVECFDLESQEWSQLPSLPASILFFCVEVARHAIFAFGGMMSTGQCNNIAYILEDGASEWQVHSTMPTRRYACKAFVHDDLDIYVVGGRVVMDPCNAVESVNLDSRSWTKHPDILVDRVFGPMLQRNNQVFILGGLQEGNNFTNGVEVFDMEKKSWRNLAPLPSKRADMASGVYEKWIVLAGGHCDYGPAKTTELYDIDKDVWHVLPQMPTPRTAGTTVVCDNKFLVIGGLGQTGPCGNVEALVFE
eukprot:gene6219-6935_t